MSSHDGERDNLSHVSSLKGTNSIHEGSALMMYSPPSSPPLSTITLRIRASTFGFGAMAKVNRGLESVGRQGSQKQRSVLL